MTSSDKEADRSRPRFVNLAGWQGFNIRDNSFWLRQRAYQGLALASPEALYFVIDPQGLHTHDAATAGAAAGGFAAGGLLGGLAGALLGSLMSRWRRGPAEKKYLPVPVPLVEEMDLTDLPAEITEDPDWPVEWDEGRVIVVPREAVRSLRTSFMTGGIDVGLAGVRIRIFTPLSKRKDMAALLADLGWGVEGL